MCVTEAQEIGDHQILGIVEPYGANNHPLLVLWDTSGSQVQQRVFEMPSDKRGTTYAPERLVSSVSTQSIGLHRADPNQRIVGVVCQGFYGDVRLDDDYVIIISTTDLCAHASTQSAGEPRIRWGEWQPSTTIVRVQLAITTVACVSGSRFFAVVGVSGTAYATLLRVYDFSPGARGRRYPNKPPVRDLIVNARHVVKPLGTISWDVSEDNLLMFHVSARKPDPRLPHATV